MLGGAIQTVKDMLFPVFCLGCKKEGVWLCESCTESIDRSGVLLCPICHEVQPYGMCCADCRQYSYIDSHIAGVVYEHGALPARMIELLKYQFVTDLVLDIVQLVARVTTEHHAMLSELDVVVPIPLHARRYAERGFNQAALIGEEISIKLDIPMQHVLVRNKYTQQQARLEKEEREINTRGAFSFRDEVSIEGKNILLIDDVFTTGSTMQAAAKTLRESGALSVVGMSVARG